MVKVLVVMEVLEEHKRMLEGINQAVSIRYVPANSVTPEDVSDVDMIIGNVQPKLLRNCKKLRILQLNSAGTDGYTREGVLPSGAYLANASGAYGIAIAEHMLGALLSLMKKLDCYFKNQENRVWKDEGSVKTILGAKTLVVGLGDIGNAFGSRMHALGSHVSGIRRNPDNKPSYVEEVYPLSSLKTCLKESDIVAACLPGYSETVKVFDAEAFAAMKTGSYFINVGRGTAVDTEALCDALESGHLAGAALDVTDPEPLPSSHRLWSMPNVLITPHVSGGYHARVTHDRIIDIAAENLRRLVKGERFTNLVDMSTGYRKTMGDAHK